MQGSPCPLSQGRGPFHRDSFTLRVRCGVLTEIGSVRGRCGAGCRAGGVLATLFAPDLPLG